MHSSSLQAFRLTNAQFARWPDRHATGVPRATFYPGTSRDARGRTRLRAVNSALYNASETSGITARQARGQPYLCSPHRGPQILFSRVVFSWRWRRNSLTHAEAPCNALFRHSRKICQSPRLLCRYNPPLPEVRFGVAWESLTSLSFSALDFYLWNRELPAMDTILSRFYPTHEYPNIPFISGVSIKILRSVSHTSDR